MINYKPFIYLLISLTLAACTRQVPVNETPVMLQRAEKFMAQGVKKYKRFQYPAARAKFILALHEYQSFNDTSGVVRSRLNLARVYLNLGELAGAEKQLSLARKIITDKQLDHLTQHADILASSLLIKQKQYEQATEFLIPYLTDNKDLKTTNPSLWRAILQNRTLIAFGKNENKKLWLQRYKQAVSTELEKYRPRLLRFEAEIALQDEGVNSAKLLLEEALELYRRQSNPRGVAYTFLEKATILYKNFLKQEAKIEFERALSAGFRIRDRLVVVSALESLITLCKELERKDEQEAMEKLLEDIRKAKKEKPWYLLRRIE